MATTVLTKRYNRKNVEPSRNTHSPDGTHYRCHWIEDSITIHSDGNVSCGLDDPHGQRSYGNIRTQTVAEIFANPEYLKLQQALWRGRRCLECGHFRAETKEGAAINPRPALPSRLVVETTVTCNIRCPNLPCLANNDPNEETRDTPFLKLETFNAMVDQLAGTLKTVNFYNYGETFMNRQAEDMLLHLRETCPDVFVVTSTNGIPLARAERAVKLVRARPNRVTFTISGASQETYARYHVNGKFAQAFAGMENVCAAKRASGQNLPQVVWRYLVFNWSDGDREIERAIAEARRIGVDRLSLYLTNTPPGSRSVRFSPGSPSFWKYSEFIHLDEEGELNQIYKCSLPDADGLYPVHDMRLFGPARWTSSRARLTLRRKGRHLRLQVSTNRRRAIEERHHCVLHTPWERVAIDLTHNAWRELKLRIPTRYAAYDAFECEITTPDHWYPDVESNPGDLRCLGVLVRAVDELAPDAAAAPPRNLLRLPAGFDPRLWGDAAPVRADAHYLRTLPREYA